MKKKAPIKVILEQESGPNVESRLAKAFEMLITDELGSGDEVGDDSEPFDTSSTKYNHDQRI